MRKAISVLVVILVGALLLSGCGPEQSEVAAKYTDEVALAIIEGSWHVAGSILAGSFICGFLSS